MRMPQPTPRKDEMAAMTMPPINAQIGLKSKSEPKNVKVLFVIPNFFRVTPWVETSFFSLTLFSNA